MIHPHSPEEIYSLLSIKLALVCAQLRDVKSIRAVARVHRTRDRVDWPCLRRRSATNARNRHQTDPTIRTHLAAPYDALLQQNPSCVSLTLNMLQGKSGKDDMTLKQSSLR